MSIIIAFVNLTLLTDIFRALRARQPRFQPGFSDENIAAIAAYLKRLDYHGPLSLAWDDTDLEKALTVVQRSKEFCLILGTEGGPISVHNSDNLDDVLKDINPQTKLAGKV